MTTLTKQEAKDAATAAAWTDEDGRTTLHSFLGMVGADHDLEGVLAEIENASEVFWCRNIFDHELAVCDANGRTYFYDVKRPVELVTS